MKKYNVIYADPPWSYDDNTGRNFQHGANKKYNTMSNKDIRDMDIESIADKNAVLFLWVTVPLLPECLETVGAWGFKYKTMLTWQKKNQKGMGYWYRGVTEHLVLATRGKVKAFRMQETNFHQCRPGKHSQKPHYFRELINRSIENSIENPVKLELFARDRNDLFPDYEYKGWDLYGNEVKNSITL